MSGVFLVNTYSILHIYTNKSTSTVSNNCTYKLQLKGAVNSYRVDNILTTAFTCALKREVLVEYGCYYIWYRPAALLTRTCISNAMRHFTITRGS